MKKRLIFTVLLAGMLSCLFYGCVRTGTTQEENEEQTVEESSETETISDDTFVSEIPSENEQTVVLEESDVDIDLSNMSAVVVYAEVYNMVTIPEDYLGKTVRARGQYASEYWEETDLTYHYVIIKDATACCAQGLEFIWEDGVHTEQADYPQDGEDIVITGTFSSYEELGTTYFYLDIDGWDYATE